MKCTSKEFLDTVRAKHPHKHALQSLDPITRDIYIFILDTFGETQYSHDQQVKLSSHTYNASSGEVVKDTDGLFSPQCFTGVGPTTYQVPVSGTYTYKVAYVNYSGVQSVPISVNLQSDGDTWKVVEPEKDAKPKCCCGAQSVGSDRHSHWCDIERNT